MASPADFAQVSRLRNVTSIRTSGDHGYLVGPELLWAWFLHTNVMARALGLWPYKDVFHSHRASATREVEALLSALSAGPVGIGDRIGEADVELIRRTCRADGVLVRPDAPIAATDRAWFDAPVWSDALLVGSTHTQHTAGRWGYVLMCNAAADQEGHDGRVALRELGEDRPGTEDVVMFDWRTRRTSMVSRAASYDVTLEPKGWDYRIIAPVLGEIAVIGDPDLYACAGDTRIADVEVTDNGVVVTVLGAGERIRLAGWSRRPVTARTWAPAVGSAAAVPTYDDSTNVWEVAVAVGSGGWTRVHLEVPR
jgi:hypothetical protein